jgi:hypothetical protein
MVQAVFLLFGALTVAWSAAIYFFLPNEPSSARFLDASDRKKAMTRVQENMTGIKNNTWKWSQSIEALLDVKIWLLVAIQVATNIANGGLHGVCASFLSYLYLADKSIVRLHRHQGHGLLDAEHFVGADAWPSIPRCIRSTYFKSTRTYFMAWNLAVALVGAVMIREVDRTQIWTRFMGYCLCIAFSANFPMVLSMSSGNIGGFTKKSTANAMVCFSPLMCYRCQGHRTDVCRSSLRIAEET